MKTNYTYFKIQMAFLLSFPVLLLSSCVSLKFDGVKELNTKTDYMKIPEGVKQLWQLQVKDEEVDQITPLNDKKVLVTTIKTELKHFLPIPKFLGVVYLYQYSNMSLVNLDNGTIDWTFSTLNFGQKSQNIIAMSPEILICATTEDSSNYFAIRPDSGKLVWTNKIMGPSDYLVTDDNKSLLLSFKEKDNLIVEKLSLKDGNVTWKSTLDINKDEKMVASHFLPGKDIDLVVGKNIISLNDNDGKIKWQNSFKNGISSSFYSEKLIWLYNNHQVVSINRITGKITNEYSLPLRDILNAIVFNNFLIVYENDSIKKTRQISCFNIDKQNLNWELPVESALKSSIYKEDNNLFFTTKNMFYDLGIKSGIVNTSILLPDTIEAMTPGIDIIQKSNDNFMITRENSIILISGKEKIVTSKSSFGIAGGFTPSYIQNKIKNIKLVMSTKDYYTSTAKLNNLATDNFNNAIRQNQITMTNTTAMYAQLDAMYAQKGASYIDQRIAIAQKEYNLEKTEAGLELAGAIANLGGAVAIAIMAPIIHEAQMEAINHDFDYMERKINTANHYQNNSICGNLCFKPYYDKGWRLAVMDVNKVGYATIPMIPDLFPLRYSVTNSIVYSIIDRGDKKFLLVKALKPLAQNPEVYTLRYLKRYNGNVAEWTLPKPSIICYDISNIKTDYAVPWTQRLHVNPRPIDKAFIDSIIILSTYINKKIIKNKVEKLLQAGANINAIDEYGHTALMYACQIGFNTCVEFLLESGANPNIEDPEGFNAFDYIYIPWIHLKSHFNDKIIKEEKMLKKYSAKFQ